MKFKLVEDIVNEVYPNKGESKEDFISRFMSVTKDEYPDRKQRYAVALSYWDRKDKKKNEDIEQDVKSFQKNEKDIDAIEDLLTNISFDEIINGKEIEEDIGQYTIWVWSDVVRFGSAWSPKPCVFVQIDREDKPNGYLGVGDMETQQEYDYNIKRLINRMRKE